MSLKAAENVYKVLVQFEPSVKAAGKMDLNQTFDNSFVKKAARQVQVDARVDGRRRRHADIRSVLERHLHLRRERGRARTPR